MRCHICDHALVSDEIKFNRRWKEFDPCGTCLEVIGEIFEPASEEDISAVTADISTEELELAVDFS